MKPATLRTLLLIGSVLLSVLGMEFALRIARNGIIAPLSGEHILREPHPTRGWALTPGKRALQRTLDYAVPVAINQHGLRDRDHDYVPAPGVTRIVVLGDSFMEAYQVDFEDSLPGRLEAGLKNRGVEVVNLGVGGYGTAQQLVQLKEVGLQYEPDIVVLAFYVGNDIQNNSHELQQQRWGPDSEKTYGRPYATSVDLASPLVWTPPDFERMRGEASTRARRREAPARALWRWVEPALVANAIARAAAAVGASPADPKIQFGWPFLAEYESPSWDAAWMTTRRILLELRDVTRRAEAEFVILVVPAKLQVESDFRERVAALQSLRDDVVFDQTRVNRALSKFSREHGIPILDPTSAFVRASETGERLYYQLEDHHWNPRGHELATQELVRFLDARALLPVSARRNQ